MSSSVHLTHEAYVDLQNRHDHFINREFQIIRGSIDQIKIELTESKNDVKEFKNEVKAFKDDVKEFKDDVKEFKNDVKEFKNDVKEFKNEVNARFDDFARRFDELRAESLRNAAYLRNTTLRNPKYPIRPLVAFRRGEIVEPDRARFPRNADEFYALRTPSTNHKRRMLAYLAEFYDVPHTHYDSSSGSGSEHDFTHYDSYSDSGSEHDVTHRPEDTVDFLESVLGLREDNFEQFRYRALEFATRPTSTVKRSQPAQELQRPRRLKLDPQAPFGHREIDNITHRPATSDHSELPDDPPVGWGTRSTPSSQRPTVNRLHQKARDSARNTRQPSEAGSTTNPNTSISLGEGANG
jgi:gas vesicle protein